jgi:hypothetical protein
VAGAGPFRGSRSALRIGGARSLRPGAQRVWPERHGRPPLRRRPFKRRPFRRRPFKRLPIRPWPSPAPPGGRTRPSPPAATAAA